jgi:hypothetical protein
MTAFLKTFFGMAIRAIAGLALAAVVLSQVAAHSGPPNGTAYVHVSSPEVEVILGGRAYQVRSLWDSPIVCELRPGTHTLKMSRNGITLHEEEFTIRAGDEVVLTAWEKATGGEDRAMAQ